MLTWRSKWTQRLTLNEKMSLNMEIIQLLIVCQFAFVRDVLSNQVGLQNEPVILNARYTPSTGSLVSVDWTRQDTPGTSVLFYVAPDTYVYGPGYSADKVQLSNEINNPALIIQNYQQEDIDLYQVSITHGGSFFVDVNLKAIVNESDVNSISVEACGQTFTDTPSPQPVVCSTLTVNMIGDYQYPFEIMFEHDSMDLSRCDESQTNCTGDCEYPCPFLEEGFVNITITLDFGPSDPYEEIFQFKIDATTTTTEAPTTSDSSTATSTATTTTTTTTTTTEAATTSTINPTTCSDPCLTSPCQHGSTCLPGDDCTFVCNCTEFYRGTLCDINDCVHCTSNPCKNGGRCHCNHDKSDFFCECPPGYNYSRICDDGCGVGAAGGGCTCLHGGTCMGSTGGCSCTCCGEWTGTNCTTPPPSGDTCADSPCGSRGECSDCNEDSHCPDSNYQCTCDINYTGCNCDERCCLLNTSSCTSSEIVKVTLGSNYTLNCVFNQSISDLSRLEISKSNRGAYFTPAVTDRLTFSTSQREISVDFSPVFAANGSGYFYCYAEKNSRTSKSCAQAKRIQLSVEYDWGKRARSLVVAALPLRQM